MTPRRAGDQDRPGLVRLALELPILLGLAALIAFGVKSLIAQAFYIPSGSMLPQLQINDRVVVSKLAYQLHDPRRGDIVVFDCPESACRNELADSSGVIVRVLRSMAEGVGVVQPSTEEFIKRVVGLPGETVEARQGRVYVNGRALIEPYLPDLVETADFSPTQVPAAHLFVMGDNRSSSSDSRVFGPIEASSVVGRTIVRVWPLGQASFL